MFDEISRRWNQWAISIDGARTRRRWSEAHPTLKGWRVGELEQPQSSRRTDSMQAALVALAQNADEAAALTLLNQFRNGLAVLARRLVVADDRFDSMGDASGEVVGVFYEVVMAHSLERRPARIAANLMLDTRQRLWRTRTGRGCPPHIVAGPIPTSITQATPRRFIPSGSEDNSADPYERRLGPDTGHGPEAIAGELDLVHAVACAISSMKGGQRSRRLTAEAAYRAWFCDQAGTEIAKDLGIAEEAMRSRLSRLRAVVRDEWELDQNLAAA